MLLFFSVATSWLFDGFRFLQDIDNIDFVLALDVSHIFDVAPLYRRLSYPIVLHFGAH